MNSGNWIFKGKKEKVNDRALVCPKHRHARLVHSIGKTKLGDTVVLPSHASLGKNTQTT